MRLLFTIFLLAGFLSTAFISKAQDDIYDAPTSIKHKKNIPENDENNYPRKINTGFVFIDGKYIEPPYKFKQKGACRIYLNGQYIFNCLTLTDTIANPYKIDELPEIPQSIDSLTSFKELKTLRDDKQRTYLGAVSDYFYTHYPYKEAGLHLYEYIKKLPNIKSINHGKFIFYNGDSLYIDFAPLFRGDFYENYGIHSHRQLPTQLELYKKGDDKIKSFIQTLKFNGVLTFNKNRINNFGYIPTIERNASFFEWNGIDSNTIPKEVWKKLEINNKKKNNNENKFQNYNNLKNTKSKSVCAFSPCFNNFIAIFPSTWDNNAFGNYNTEIYNIDDYINEYDYNYSNSNFFYDNTPNDDICGYLFYNAVKNMASNAGILLVGTHGRPPNDPDSTHLIDNGFFLWFATTENAIKQWCNDDPLVHPTYIAHDHNVGLWNQNVALWGAFVHSDWVDAYWKNTLENNKAITILSSCYSYTNNMVESCKGGIAFGYNASSYEDNSISNEKGLFKRMNGQWDNGNYREASDAYLHMPNHYDAFMYSANNLMTLCPAPQSKYPDNGDVVSNAGTGYFDIDTWCRIGSNQIIDPTSSSTPIWFETQGNIQVSNVHWDNPEGSSTNLMAHKIVYD